MSAGLHACLVLLGGLEAVAGWMSVGACPDAGVRPAKPPSRRPAAVAMDALARRRRPENVEGEVFVDESCINCDTCRWMAPSTFSCAGGASAVHAQPQTQDELFRALQAAAACPTGSIRTVTPQPMMKDVVKSFPHPIPEVSGSDVAVYHNGFHSRASYGAASYLVVRDGGNVLVDSPRYFGPLEQKIRAMGGVEYMFLTHEDDVADHERWKAAFPRLQRFIHEKEATSTSLRAAECVLQGTGPWDFPGGGRIMFQPGHTAGHLVLQLAGVLYTGDHLAVTRQAGQLAAFRGACWYSWDKQIASVQALAADPGTDFRTILPGHGRALVCSSASEMKEHLSSCIQWMKSVA